MFHTPDSTRALVVTELGNKFRDVTEIRSVPLSTPPRGHVLVKNKFLGMNASDINYTSGWYDPAHTPPMTAGMESLGEVVAVGDGVSLKVGQCVVVLNFGCFAELVSQPVEKLVPVPSLDPALMSIVVSGLTASISLEQEADLKEGKTVLVTAAAGGTGQFAVQIAKMAGCHVIGTCSTPEKCEFLKNIGCDRVINYKTEKVGDVLKKEYPQGLDVVYECIGKEMFDVCLENLAVKGRLIVIGAVSDYQRSDMADRSAMVSKLPVSLMCLHKSASVRGFFLRHYSDQFVTHIGKLMSMYLEGTLKVTQDNGCQAAAGPFKGLEKLADAHDHMFSGKNIGKVIVEI